MNKEDDRFSVGLEHIKDLKNTSSSYFQDTLFTKAKRIQKYNKRKLPLGRKRDGSVYYLDIEEAFRLFVCGATRSGKKN